jgi:hypothetical protein
MAFQSIQTTMIMNSFTLFPSFNSSSYGHACTCSLFIAPWHRTTDDDLYLREETQINNKKLEKIPNVTNASLKLTWSLRVCLV